MHRLSLIFPCNIYTHFATSLFLLIEILLFFRSCVARASPIAIPQSDSSESVIEAGTAPRALYSYPPSWGCRVVMRMMMMMIMLVTANRTSFESSGWDGRLFPNLCIRWCNFFFNFCIIIWVRVNKGHNFRYMLLRFFFFWASQHYHYLHHLFIYIYIYMLPLGINCSTFY